MMNRQGTMKLIHVNETIKEIFKVTGFSDILTIE
jgi:anti-sigma B factor antagonist